MRTEPRLTRQKPGSQPRETEHPKNMSRKRQKIAIGIVGVLGLFLALFSFPSPPGATPCSDEWAAGIEKDYVQSSDGEGHGPDQGSSEWYHQIEHGLHMEPLPTTDHDVHCDAVAQQIAGHRYIRSRLFGALFRLY
jgi:hypothetical protein